MRECGMWNVECGMTDAPGPPPAPQRRCSHSAFGIRNSAFTVTELLIVIGILVLVLALAVPAFNLITGARSAESANNQVGGLLARARNEAIGLQQVRGVFFYIDPATNGVNIALVEQADPPAVPLNVDVYLDLTSDRDNISFPKGIAVAGIDDVRLDNTKKAKDDKYICFNTHNGSVSAEDTQVQYGPVILFDSRGQLACKSYALRVRRPKPGAGVGVEEYTPMGVLLYQPIDPTTTAIPVNHKDLVPVDPSPANIANSKVLRSQLGYTLFDIEAYTNANQAPGTRRVMEDYQILSPGATSLDGLELAEEQWLDENATPVLINRYTGALVKPKGE
jgi:type II secretory pathway pseudopilin PulG